jgi:hypothetical protein
MQDQASGGLVDKIVVHSEGFAACANFLSPGSHKSLTKVDYRALNNASLSVVGLYGKREVLIDFLAKHDLAVPLRPLEPGIYLFTAADAANDCNYLVLWPTPEMWSAGEAPAGAAVKTRTTLMRYLSKLTDQQLCLMDDADLAGIQEFAKKMSNLDVKATAFTTRRLFTFSVDAVQESEADVKISDGFPLTAVPVDHDVDIVDIVPGHAAQAVLTTVTLPEQVVPKRTCVKHTPMMLKKMLG